MNDAPPDDLEQARARLTSLLTGENGEEVSAQAQEALQGVGFEKDQAGGWRLVVHLTEDEALGEEDRERIEAALSEIAQPSDSSPGHEVPVRMAWRGPTRAL